MVSRWKAAAMIRDIDDDAIACRVRVERHLGVPPREFERVVQQVFDGCQQQVSIALDFESFLDFGDGQYAFGGKRIE